MNRTTPVATADTRMEKDSPPCVILKGKLEVNPGSQGRSHPEGSRIQAVSIETTQEVQHQWHW